MKATSKAKSNKILTVTCRGHMDLDFGAMVPFQGALKTLDQESFTKLRASILEFGITFPFFVWPNRGKFYCMDGHQRDLVLKQLHDEGYKIPMLPVDLIEAKNEKEAKLKLLLVSSNYGTKTADSLAMFIKDSGLEIERIMTLAQMPEFAMPAFLNNFDKPGLIFNGATPDGSEAESEAGGQNLGLAVRMVQLFLDDNSLPIFTQHIEALSARYNTQNLTDTVLAGLADAHNQIKKKAS